MNSIADWYTVTYDQARVFRKVAPPGGEAWEDSFAWSEIVRVCYEPSESFMSSDTFHIFTSLREESFSIPSEAKGAAELWGEVIRRGLFDAKVSIEISTGKRGITCFPPFEES